MDHVIPDFYVLIEWHPHDDTMSVVCHWHHDPSEDEILAMIECLPLCQQDRFFFITRS